MSVWYIDTSAALKLIVDEPESDALVETLQTQAPTLVSCLLLETELRRAVNCRPQLSQAVVTDLLTRVNLYEIAPAWFTAAGLLPGEQLRTLDALHVASAIHLRADRLLTYDARMAQAALSVGMPVADPRPGKLGR